MNPRWEIMVVDDEEVMRESLAAWLKEDGSSRWTCGGMAGPAAPSSSSA